MPHRLDDLLVEWRGERGTERESERGGRIFLNERTTEWAAAHGIGCLLDTDPQPQQSPRLSSMPATDLVILTAARFAKERNARVRGAEKE